MKLKAFTFAEMLLVLIVLSVIIAFTLGNLKPHEIKDNAYKKLAQETYNELTNALANIRLTHSQDGTYLNLYSADKSQLYSIGSTGATTYLAGTIKKGMQLSRQAPSITVDGYSDGALMKNGVFVAFKSYDNCTTSATTYNPTLTPNETVEDNICALVLYDINEAEVPNKLGKDRYILAIDKEGIK